MQRLQNGRRYKKRRIYAARCADEKMAFYRYSLSLLAYVKSEVGCVRARAHAQSDLRLRHRRRAPFFVVLLAFLRKARELIYTARPRAYVRVCVCVYVPERIPKDELLYDANPYWQWKCEKYTARLTAPECLSEFRILFRSTCTASLSLSDESSVIIYLWVYIRVTASRVGLF